MNTTIVAIAAEWERPYIREWAEYHHNIGFDEITVYLNNCEAFDLPNYAHQIRCPGIAMQMPAYNDFMEKCPGTSYDWATFIDIDEFVVLKKHGNVKELFSDHSDDFALTLNWKIYGSSGHKCVIDGNFSVLDRFKLAQKGVNPHVKTSLNLGKIRTYNGLLEKTRWSNPHFCNPAYNTRFSKNTHGQYVFGPFDPNGSDNIAFLAHYITKSKEECKIRRSHIRADIPSIREEGWEEFFTAHDKNECEMNILEYM